MNGVLDGVNEGNMSETGTTIRIIEPLSEPDARASIGAIRDGWQLIQTAGWDLRRSIIDFDERLGWKALGYSSLAQCFERELGKSFQTGYRQLKVALVERNIREHSDLPSPIPERHVRDTGLAQLQPVQQAEAYQNARQMAAAEGKPAPTAEHVRQSVQIITSRLEVYTTPYHVVSHMVTRGEITVATAKAMTAALDKLAPKIRGMVVQLIARHGLTCPDLVSPLGDMFSREQTGKPSKTLATVLATGYLGSTLLKSANLTDLAQAREEARLEHISEAVSQKSHLGNGVQAVIITVLRGNAKRTLKALKDALSVEDLGALLEMLEAERERV